MRFALSLTLLALGAGCAGVEEGSTPPSEGDIAPSSAGDFEVLVPHEGIDPEWHKQPKEKFDSVEKLYEAFFDRMRAKDFEGLQRLTVSKEEHQQQLFPVFYAHKKDSPTYEFLRTFTWRQLFLESASGAIDNFNWVEKVQPEFHGMTEPTAIEEYEVAGETVTVFKRIQVKYSTPDNPRIRSKRIFGHVLQWGDKYCFLFYPN